MRFVVDECTGPAVAAWLREEGHDALSIHDESPGMPDVSIVTLAHQTGRILITNDKDFGEAIFRQNMPHSGVILLRLQDERAASKMEALRRLLATYAERLPGQFVVVTERAVRFGQ